jgi:hypothetical protein
LGMFGHLRHPVIYLTKQGDDKLFRSHGAPLQQFDDYRLYAVRDLFSTSTHGY